MVQLAPAARLAPNSVTEFEPSAAVRVPLQVLVRPLGDATIKPAGNVSVKPIPLRAMVSEFAMVKVKVVFWFTSRLVARKAFISAGGSKAENWKVPDRKTFEGVAAGTMVGKIREVPTSKRPVPTN